MVQAHPTAQPIAQTSIDEEILNEWSKTSDFLIEVKNAEEFLTKLKEDSGGFCVGFHKLLYTFGIYNHNHYQRMLAKKIQKRKRHLEKQIEMQKDLLQSVEKQYATLLKCSDAYKQHYDNCKAILEEKSKKYESICTILATPELSLPENKYWAEFLGIEKAELERNIELMNEKLARINEVMPKTCKKISDYKTLVYIIKKDLEYALSIIDKFDEIQKNLRVDCYVHPKPLQADNCAKA